jgi:hypothetical protein
VVSLRATAGGFAPVERPSCRAGERVEIVLRPGVSLRVDARSPKGEPAANVEFVLERHRHSGTVAFRRTATTGEDGLARFHDLPPGVSASLSLGATSWGWPEHARAVALPDSGEARVEVALSRGRTLTGHVTDAETGTPIAGARVGMGWWNGQAVTTDASGAYALHGWTGGGVREISVHAEGYGQAKAIVGAASVVDVALVRGDTVVGRVVGPDRAPVGDAVVAVVGSAIRGREQVTSRAEGTTSPDGRFALGALRRDLPHTLVVMSAGYGRTLVDFDPRAGGPGEIDLGDVVLPLGRTILGRVLRHDGTPVAGAHLELTGANPDRGRLRSGGAAIEDVRYGRTEEATAAADGRFAFADLAPGTYGIEAWTPGMTSRHATVRVGSEEDPEPVDIRFLPGRTIRVVVVDDEGRPVPSAYVFVAEGSGPRNQVTNLDAHGTATLLVPDSVRSIMVHPPDPGEGDGRRFLPSSPEFPIDPEASEIRCVLRTGLAIAGRVTGPDGADVATAGLEVTGREGTVAWTLADDEGRFEAIVPPDEGPYVVRLDGSTGGWPSGRDAGLAGAVSGVVAGTRDVLVKARPVTRDGVQVVRVIDPEAKPVAGAKVLAVWARERGRATVVADDTGEARLAGLPDLPCSWRAEPASAEGDLLPSYGGRAEPSATPVTVRMRRGLRVRGRVEVPEDARGQRIRVLVMQAFEGRRVEVREADPSFSVLLDPEDGEGGSVSVSIGPDEAPTHVVRVDVARFGAEPIVLTPTKVE